ncbi:MAG: tryptophan synthase alpha chain [Candidatus Tectimicrobiota bacterium]|nr:MAG: tryptophan synthase alpha chain [Candidatus Tectomicrobia bacterium]
MASLEAYIRQRQRHKALLLMGHAVVGYPSLEANWQMLEAMQQAQVDLVELQLPFSEPIADGPVFVRANQQALAGGMTREQYFAFMQRAARAFDFPLLMMGYYNSIFQMGHERFCACLAEHGGRGFIIADLPPEEAGDLWPCAEAYGLAPIVLMTPLTPVARLHHLARFARGFVYCVARKGVTGKQTAVDRQVQEFLHRCRQATPLPLALGFGLRRGADLECIRGWADIAVVGTALLQAWEEGGPAAYRSFLAALARAAAGPT